MYPSIHLWLTKNMNIAISQRIRMSRISGKHQHSSDVPPQPNRYLSQIFHRVVYSDIRGATHAYRPRVGAIVVGDVGRGEVGGAFAAWCCGVVGDAGGGKGGEGGEGGGGGEEGGG